MSLALSGIILAAIVAAPQRTLPPNGRFALSTLGFFSMGANGDPLGLTAIRQRGPREAMGWDQVGRERLATTQELPAPPSFPNRKIREFVFAWPRNEMLIASAPPGAEIVQIARDRTTAGVTVAFPTGAQAGGLDVFAPRTAAKRLRAVPFRPFSGFKQAEGTPEERFGHRLRWFAVPKAPATAYYRLFDAAGKPLEMLGQVQRRGDERTYLAILDEKASSLRKVELWAMEPEWRLYESLLLDPAPAPKLRPSAPSQTVALEDGGEASLIAVEAVTPGRPYAAWAVDGGAPAETIRRSWGVASSVPPDRELRQINVRFRWPSSDAPAPHYRWPSGSGKPTLDFGYGGPDSQFVMNVPRNQSRADIGFEYAAGRWETLLEEEEGGNRLKSSTRLIYSGSSSSPSIVAVRYTIPEHLRDRDLSVEALDVQGRPLPRTKGPIMIGLEPGHPQQAHFHTSSSFNVARIRLLSRPWRKAEFRAVPLQPR